MNYITAARNLGKRSAALALALLMLCTMIPAEVFADLVWYLDESGNLFAAEEPAAVQVEQSALIQGTSAEEPAQPEEPFTYITGTAEDSAVFTAYGRFPEGAEMFVTQCDFGGELMKKVFPAERAEKITEYKAYDVSFTLNGEPYDPEMVPQFTVVPNMQNPVESLDVSAYSSYISTVPENEDGIVLSSKQVEEMIAAGEEDSVHYVSETFYNLFDIEAEHQGENKLVFWSDLYTPIVIYREGFDFEPVPWVLSADRSVTLSSILETAGIGLGLPDIADQGIICLGDPELVKMRVREFDGDWEISSAQSFTAAQVLKVVFKNGGVLNIELYCEGNEPAPVIENEKETYDDWVEMFRDVELSGYWPRDVVAIAQTQLGYTAGENGYTRYGEWYGDPYGDWCAMFCSFCMAFAGVDSTVMPYEQSCERWVEQLKMKELYHDAASGYAPKAGDLIFFSSNGSAADHAGIVYDNEPGQIVTIEGNNPEKVCTVNHSFYLHDDARILGYGEMPECSADLDISARERETYSDWEEMFRNVELTGKWPRDVVTIAETQLGYSADEDGYTRYGAWYGNECADWCAMFCSFCMAFAGVDREAIPYEQSCERWIEQLKIKELYYDAASGYSPKAGDLIFFSSNGTESDHVGIVCENEPEQIVIIDGNNPDQVEQKFYLHDDSRILGYGEMPENPIELVEGTIESAPAEDGAIAVISGNLPEGAEAVITAVGLSAEEVSEYLGADAAAAITEYVAYDIKIMVNGEEWQPDDSVSITVEQPDIAVSTDGLAVAHIKSSDNSVVSLPSQVDEEGSICFTTDGFSVFVFYLFTVDYYYGEMEYHQPGMSTLYLSELFGALEIGRAVEDVVSVEFSRPDLLQVAPAEGDWTLTSLQAFDSAEMLTVVFSDGSEITLNVFDAVTVLLTIPDNYNIITTATDVEELLTAFDVRSSLSLPENTAVKSITVTPTNRLSTKTSDGKKYIVCTNTFTTPATCTVAFDAQDEGGNDIACQFTNITADDAGRYTLWDYSGGRTGANSPKIIQGYFEDVIGTRSGVKDWYYPTSATDNSNIHTDNAPVGYSRAVFTTKNGTNVNPISINGENYYLYVSSNQLTTAYNGPNYRSGWTTDGIQLGRFSRQTCSLPCVKGQIYIVAWIEDGNGNKVILPDVCVGNEGASSLWNWKFGGQGGKYIFTNDGVGGGSGLSWNNSTGTKVSREGRFQGIMPDSNGYYTLYLSPNDVDELSVFKFNGLTTVKKTVLDASGNPVTGSAGQFSFGSTYTPQVSSSSGTVTENFTLANGQTHGISGAFNTSSRVWEVVDPLYTTTIKVNNSTVQTTTETITPESGEPYQIIRPANDQTVSTSATSIEFINRKNHNVFISKKFTGLTLEQIAALRDNVTAPFTITAVRSDNQKVYRLSLKQHPGSGYTGYCAVSDDGMTYTWELPRAGQYVLSESGTSVGGYRCTSSIRVTGGSYTESSGSYTVSFTSQSTNRAEIENSYTLNTATLTVTKTVSGSSPGTFTRFPVRIQASAEDSSPADLKQYEDDIVSPPGANVTFSESIQGSGIFDIVEFTIAHNESFTIPIASGSEVKITETEHNGYSVMFTVTDEEQQLSDIVYGDRYVIESMPASAVTAAITNTPGIELPKTGGEGISRYCIAGSLLMASACIYGILLKRKRERRAE